MKKKIKKQRRKTKILEDKKENDNKEELIKEIKQEKK